LITLNFSSAIVEVIVTNVNDNEPYFINLPYNFTIPEDIEKSSLIGRIMAEDIDGDNLTYSIISSGKLVCSLIGRIMAEDIDGDNLTYSIASSGKLVYSLIGRIMAEDIDVF
jgi:hypothetical protein